MLKASHLAPGVRKCSAIALSLEEGGGGFVFGCRRYSLHFRIVRRTTRRVGQPRLVVQQLFVGQPSHVAQPRLVERPRLIFLTSCIGRGGGCWGRGRLCCFPRLCSCMKREGGVG
jgi:hypothetical protein